MRALFLCNTVYQIIVAAIVSNSNLNMESDIILSDHFVGSKDKVLRINENKKVFKKAYYLETKYLQFDNSYKEIKKTKKRLSNLLTSSYDYLFVANQEKFSMILYNYLHKINNKLILNWFEDGVGTYSVDGKEITKKVGLLHKIKASIYGYTAVSKIIKDLYVFMPDKIDWDTTGINIKKINGVSNDIKDYLNNIFDYNSLEDDYNKKLIFFEDGYKPFSDKIDLDALNVMKKYYNNDDILVKIHPRNTNNKFSGFNTNKNISIPWELIVLNNDFSNTLLVTFFSSCVITPYMILGKNVKSIVLSKLYLGDNDDYFFDYLNRKFYINNENVFMPSSLAELDSYMEKERGNI